MRLLASRLVHPALVGASFIAASAIAACSSAKSGVGAVDAGHDATGVPTFDAHFDPDTGAPHDAGVPSDAVAPVITSFFWTPAPAGQQPVIDAINAAKTSIHMFMYHLTQMDVVDALTAAEARGVDVQLIVDQGEWSDHTPAAISSALATGKVSVTPSSKGFSITHAKAFVVDEQVAFIMNLNLTSPYPTTRDYAVSTTDPGVIKDILAVFAQDLTNAEAGTATTPPLSSPYLLWSPVNSKDTIVAFIGAAKKTLIATTENLGNADVQAAFTAAAARGVAVRVLTPLCDQNADVTYDIPFLLALDDGGVQAHAMPAPSSATVPYMHAKLMIADGERAYVGSMNDSNDSLDDAREVGLLFTDPATIAAFMPIFESDWAASVVPPQPSTIMCPATTSN